MGKFFVPHGATLRCDIGLKTSSLNVVSQSTARMDNCKLWGTYMDKPTDNFNCPQIGTVGAVIALVACMGVLTVASSAALAVVGGLIGGVIGLAAGIRKNPGDGSMTNGELHGRQAGGFVGEVIGGSTGKVTGMFDSSAGKSLHEREMTGYMKGSVSGRIKGEDIGSSMGRGVGRFFKRVANACKGMASGAYKGGALGMGIPFLPFTLTGSLVNRIPNICSMTTLPTWEEYHSTVKTGGKYVLLQNSVLKCTRGGEISVLIIKNPRTAMACALASMMVYDNPELKERIDRLRDKYGFEFSVVENKDLPIQLRTRGGDNPLDDEDSGFKANIYKVKDGNDFTYILAFRGTRPEELQDWLANYEQGFGEDTEQYEQTGKVSAIFNEHYGAESKAIAGHSKGGGQAALGGFITGIDTYTFNAAGVHERTFEKHGQIGISQDTKSIQAFHAEGKDILSRLQDHREAMKFIPGLGGLVRGHKALPEAAGIRIGLETAAPGLLKKPIEGHLMPHTIDALDKEIEKQPSENIFAGDK